MIQLPQFIIDLVGQSKYVLLFIGAIVEGPVVMLTAGFLYRVGQFSFLPMFAALVAGDFLADLAWYGVGYFGASNVVKKYGSYVRITPEVVEKIQTRFKSFQASILIVSKLTMGFGFALATLVVAGMLKVPFGKYAMINLIGGLIWTAVLVVIGFFFGNVFLLVSDPFKIAFVAGLAAAVIAFLRYASRRLAEKDM